MAGTMMQGLRDELVLHPGPMAMDGSPTWTLHDPARNKYFRLTWPAFEILSRWDAGGPEAVAERVNAETTLHIIPEDVEGMGRFIDGNFLSRAGQPEHTARLAKVAQSSRQSWAHWLLHHYLFFRVPLVRPDRWLDRVAPSLDWTYGAAARWATLAALVLGLLLAGRQWDAFVHTLVSTATLSGLLAYGLALAGAKAVHEMAHAVTAKRLCCRVPSMGLAFLVMWPVLYTDVTDAWKLTSRRQRLAIGGAGIVAELTVAVWASLAWALLPDGPARGAAFVLATITWVGTLAINLSPFMRFDGYFLLMDAFDLPNLHNRSFALARWWLREVLFALGEPVPEILPAGRRALLIGFGFATWIYRLVLFLGIAALVYHFFVKAVGVLLFAVEIGWFVALPFIVEFREWWKRRAAIAAGRRGRRLGWGLGGLLLLALVPWQATVSAPALLKAAEHGLVFTATAARLDRLEVGEGQQVAKGQVLAVLSSPDLEYRLAREQARAEVLRYEMAAIAFEPSFRERAQVLEQELAGAVAARLGLGREAERLIVTAAAAGRVVDLDPSLKPGQWLAGKTPLMAVADDANAVIEALVDEHALDRLAIGNACSFHPDDPAWPVLTCRIARIDKVGSPAIHLPQLTEPNGGPIAIRPGLKTVMADKAYYRVRLELPHPHKVAVELRGTALIEAGSASLLGGVLKGALAVLMRELGV